MLLCECLIMYNWKKNKENLMIFFNKIVFIGVVIFLMILIVYVENFNIKYSLNYLMFVYVNFKYDSGKYEI